MLKSPVLVGGGAACQASMHEKLAKSPSSNALPWSMTRLLFTTTNHWLSDADVLFGFLFLNLQCQCEHSTAQHVEAEAGAEAKRPWWVLPGGLFLSPAHLSDWPSLHGAPPGTTELSRLMRHAAGSIEPSRRPRPGQTDSGTRSD